jgi:hypothetical protein
MAKSRKAETGNPVSEKSNMPGNYAAADHAVGEVEAVAEGGEGSDVQPSAAERAPFDFDDMVDVTAPEFSPMRAMADKPGAIHAVYVRCTEMLPYLEAATAEAEGDLKDFLWGLHYQLLLK